MGERSSKCENSFLLYIQLSGLREPYRVLLRWGAYLLHVVGYKLSTAIGSLAAQGLSSAHQELISSFN